RLKQNIEPLKGGIDQLLQLRGVTFEWKKPEERMNQTGTQTGFIAQDVEKAFPKWVGEDDKGFKYVSVPPIQLPALEGESIRTLKQENDELRKRIEALEGGHRPIASNLGATGFGLGFAGLAVAGAVFVSRRKKDERSS